MSAVIFMKTGLVIESSFLRVCFPKLYCAVGNSNMILFMKEVTMQLHILDYFSLGLPLPQGEKYQ